MTISYNWLQEYLPEVIEPEKLSKILTSIGLEVESMQNYESLKGGLEGLIVGEVITCQQHPNADKLKVTTVNIGKTEHLQIVCGAANVAAGQKVIVATVGATIYPMNGEPLTMKVAKIRGIESHGMICAEDEIGLSSNHDGIMVLPNHVPTGTQAADYFNIYKDVVVEIGLTPNRMDAMSHYGVAKDVCAYMNHHFKKDFKPKNIYQSNTIKAHPHHHPITIQIHNTAACKRYGGVVINNITVKESPLWLKNKLNAIGVKSINNIVDITNFILHETGQPLHAFDLTAIKENTVNITTLPNNTPFVTLDNVERKLTENDLMICNGLNEPLCIAGVYGGLSSGVSNNTTAVFLESAYFDAVYVRKTSKHHNLRTDAATRFEKGVDISKTLEVLKRAAALIIEVAGGNIEGDFIDVYPTPVTPKVVALKYNFLKKLSGKNYHPDTVKKILTSLGFGIEKETLDEVWCTVPFNKTDITLPADLVEEIIRIDGLDNIDIPKTITITPAINTLSLQESVKEKIATYLSANGFAEIVTNSITNSKYYGEDVLSTAVKMLNSLTVELDTLRPTMVETGLETIAYNINRKNTDLLLYEIGKTYSTKQVGSYTEVEELALFVTGLYKQKEWHTAQQTTNIYFLKGMVQAIMQLIGVNNIEFTNSAEEPSTLQIIINKQLAGTIKELSKKQLNIFDIKQPVYYANIYMHQLIQHIKKNKIVYKEVSKFPTVSRDIAVVVDKHVSYGTIENIIHQTKISKLQQVRLFDVFENEKLGTHKKSMAINFTFTDNEKTLTDKEIDAMMQKIMSQLEKHLAAEIRK